LIEILLAHRTLPQTALLAAMDTAVATGMLDPQVVLIEARRCSAAEDQPDGAIPIGAWAHYDRPALWRRVTISTPESPSCCWVTAEPAKPTFSPVSD
jgi:hypothetical protein